jgi:hypothetical protein
MKKVFFLFLLVAAGRTLNAQAVYRASDNPAYTVPAFIKADFEVNNPGVTVISWDMVQGYWRASYKIDNRLNYDFYDQSGVDFRASLPVIQNNVPEAVVTTALNVHGPIVYGITKVKSANSTDIYQLRLLENGTTRIVWMDADGKAVTDVFKVKPDDAVVKAKQE